MSSPSSPDSLRPVDLRHMTSSTGLATPGKEPSKDLKALNRVSQHLSNHRIGTRTPTSIPSSPTSVHSSSSAIFERDIEPIGPPSPPHQTNPHRIARSKGTEQIEQSVPSVLDSAATILAQLDDDEPISVVAPAPGRTSGWASPIGSLRSRSPSPLGSRGTPGTNRTSLLLSIPHPHPHALPSALTPMPELSPQYSPSPARPVIQTNIPPAQAPPADSTPTSAYYSTISSADSSPTTTTREHPQHAFPPASPPSALPAALPSPATHTQLPSPVHTHTLLPSPPSPRAVAKRLSFMSYADLLSSTPASTLPLASLTTSASSVEPPPHIPSVSGLAQHSAGFGFLGGGTGSAAPSVHRDRDSIALLDDVGGEWEREGLGRGLEERLEALMPVHGRA